MTTLREQFGRPLRLAIVGGGPEAWIGRMHRGAAEMDGWWQAVAGVFSSDPARSRAAAPAMGFDPARSYGSVEEMLERERQRADGIEAVAIVTPNDTHYPFSVAALDAGLDVVCDKPVTETFAEARDLVARTRRGNRLFAIAHAYSAYPMTRHARMLVARRRAGRDPARAGRVHPGRARDARRGRPAEQPAALGPRPAAKRAGAGDERDRLPRAASRVFRRRARDRARLIRHGRADAGSQGRRLRVGADRARRRRARNVHGDAGGRRRQRTTFACASTARRECSIGRIAKRAICKLALIGEPVADHRSRRSVSRAGDRRARAHAARTSGRAARSVREHLRESSRRSALRGRWASQSPAAPYPRIEDGAHTMAFIEACVASQRSGRWVDVARGEPA